MHYLLKLILLNMSYKIKEMKPLFVLRISVLLSLEQYVVADNTEEIFADETPSNNKQPISSKIFANHRKQKLKENPSNNKQLLSSTIFSNHREVKHDEKLSNNNHPLSGKISANYREHKHNENTQKKEITTEHKVYSDEQRIRRFKPFLYTNLSRSLLLWLNYNLLGVNFTKFPNNNQSLASETIGVTLSTSNQLKNTHSHYNEIFTGGEPSTFNLSQFNTEQPISSEIFEVSESSTSSKKDEPLLNEIFPERGLSSSIKSPANDEKLFSSKIFGNHRKQTNHENLQTIETSTLQTTVYKGSSDDRSSKRKKPLYFANNSDILLPWINENLIGVDFVHKSTKIPNHNQSLTSNLPTDIKLSTSNQLETEQPHVDTIFTTRGPRTSNEAQLITKPPLSCEILEVSEPSMSSKIQSNNEQKALSIYNECPSNNKQPLSSKIFANHKKQKPSTSRQTQSNNEQPPFNNIFLTTELPTSSKTKSNNDQLLSSDIWKYSDWSSYYRSNNGKTHSDENLPNNELILAVHKLFDNVWTAFRMHKKSHNVTKTTPWQLVSSDEPPPRSQITLLNFTDLIPTNAGLGCDRIAFLINLNRTNKWKAVPDLQVVPYPKVGYRWQEGESINVEALAKHNHYSKLPSSYDSRKIFPICSSLREPLDQGCNCLASWAVSAASAFSDRLCISSNGKINTQLSAQHVLSCSDGEVCKGRQSLKAWMYFKNHGVFSGSHYGQTRGCQSYLIEPCMESTKQKTDVFSLCSADCQPSYFDKNVKPILYKASRVYSFINTSINAIKHEIFHRGPVTAEIKVFEDFQCYMSGIYNHVVGEDLGYTSVKVIGWGREKNIPYWLIANTWGVQWGEQGFSRVHMEASGLNIESYISAGIPITDLEIVEVF